MIEVSRRLHCVIRAAGRDNQSRIIQRSGVAVAVIARFRRLTIETFSAQIAISTGSHNGIIDLQSIGKDMAVVFDTGDGIIRGVIQLMITLHQGDPGNAGVILDNDVGFFVEGNGIAQRVGIPVLRGGLVTVHDIVSVVLIGIVDGGIVYHQLKTIELLVRSAVRIQVISTFRGHALGGDHAVDGAVGNRQCVCIAACAVIQVVGRDHAVDG